MKPCPFCGHPVDMTNEDTLYPSGVGWKDRPEVGRSYHHLLVVPQEQWCYSMHCVSTSGGCGAEVVGDSKQEAIEKWNRRVTRIEGETLHEGGGYSEGTLQECEEINRKRDYKIPGVEE